LRAPAVGSGVARLAQPRQAQSEESERTGAQELTPPHRGGIAMATTGLTLLHRYEVLDGVARRPLAWTTVHGTAYLDANGLPCRLPRKLSWPLSTSSHSVCWLLWT